MNVTVMLKLNGFRYSGELISESETELILIDKKLGRLVIQKSEIAVRGDY